MAEIGAVTSELFGGLLGGSAQILIWVFGGILFVAIVGGIIWYGFIYRKRFDITVKIISKRTGDNRIFFDNAAILNDQKNNTRYLKLWKTGVELELPKFDIMYHTNRGDYIELYRDSELGFNFLTPPRIIQDEIVRHDGKIYPVVRSKQYKIEQDIDWTLNRQKKNKSIINPESFLMKLLEFTPQIISMVISMMIIWVMFKYGPVMLNQLQELATTIKGPGAGGEVAVIGSIIPSLLWKKKI
ncbi:MAG TPA: hypothetical protein VGA29_02560 [Ignavibacteriaceae bacterium]